MRRNVSICLLCQIERGKCLEQSSEYRKIWQIILNCWRSSGIFFCLVWDNFEMKIFFKTTSNEKYFDERYFSKRLKILRRRIRIPGRKQIDLANYSVTGNEAECTQYNSPQYFGSKGSFYRKVFFFDIFVFSKTQSTGK